MAKRLSEKKYAALIEAARTLRDYCNSKDMCRGCVFWDNVAYRCMQNGTPGHTETPEDPATATAKSLMNLLKLNNADFVDPSERTCEFTTLTRRKAESARDIVNESIKERGIEVELTYTKKNIAIFTVKVNMTSPWSETTGIRK